MWGGILVEKAWPRRPRIPKLLLFKDPGCPRQKAGSRGSCAARRMLAVAKESSRLLAHFQKFDIRIAYGRWFASSGSCSPDEKERACPQIWKFFRKASGQPSRALVFVGRTLKGTGFRFQSFRGPHFKLIINATGSLAHKPQTCTWDHRGH